jgi:O-antigen/teichoic acid export membrane protein
LARRAAEWAAVTVASVPLSLFYSVILARALGPDARGQYAVFTTAVGIISGILALGLGVVARAEIATDPSKARSVHSNLLWFTLLVGAALFVAQFLLPHSLKASHPFDRSVPLILCAVSLIYSGYGTLFLQGLGHFRWVNALRLGRSGLDIVCIGIFVIALRFGLGGAIWSWTTAGVVSALIMLSLITKATGAPGVPSGKAVASSLKHGWKILVAGQAVALQTSLVILLLNKTSTSGQVGVFAIALGLSAQAAMVCATLAAVASDRIAGPNRGKSEELVKQLARISLALAVPMLIGAVVLSHLVVSLLYGAAYASAAPLFVILLAGTLVSQVTEVHAQFLIGQHWKSLDTMVLNLFNLAVAAGLSFALIPRYGAIGAAISLSSAYTLNAFMYYLLVKRTMGCASSELLLLKGSDVRKVMTLFNFFPGVVRS